MDPVAVLALFTTFLFICTVAIPILLLQRIQHLEAMVDLHQATLEREK